MLFCIKKQGVKKMSQKLILPMDKCNVNAGYKMAAYVKEWGFAHYGIDWGTRTVSGPFTARGTER